MKNTLEAELLKRTLEQDKPAGTVLATIWLDLPQSNGRIHLCVYVQPFRKNPVALLQKVHTNWTYRDPELPYGYIGLPNHIYKYIMRTMHYYGVVDVIGIEPDDTTIDTIDHVN